jgi:hypothetical protein
VSVCSLNHFLAHNVSTSPENLNKKEKIQRTVSNSSKGTDILGKFCEYQMTSPWTTVIFEFEEKVGIIKRQTPLQKGHWLIWEHAKRS